MTARHEQPRPRPEVELLLSCAQSHVGADMAEHLRALARAHLDWDFVLRVASRHRLLPLLYHHLKATCPDAVPTATLDRLRSHFIAVAARNLFLTQELIGLLKLLDEHGIVGIPFKGPAVAASLYDDLALREFEDLDIFVRKQDVVRIEELLIAHGYYRESHVLRRHDHKVTVELQRGPMRKPYAFPPDFERCWDRVEPLSLAGTDVHYLPPTDVLLFLCVHGCKHLWERLLWVCDVAELVRVHHDIEWSACIASASALGGRRMLFVGLLLARQLLDAPVPEAVLSRARSDSEARALAEQISDGLLHRTEDPINVAAEAPVFFLRMRERLRDKLELCVRLSPTLRHPVRFAKTYGLRPLKHLVELAW
jgi:hypothetical protein